MKDRHILITGGSQGIGFEIAKATLAHGATVHITGRRESLLKEAKQQLGERVFIYPGDIADPSTCEQTVRAVGTAAGGRLDGLVVNAAKYNFRPLLEVDNAELDNYFKTNVYSTVKLVQAAYPFLKAGTGKSVLFISSTLGARPVSGTGAYSATKAAMNSLTKSFAIELGQDRIRVNAVLPGLVDTPIHEPQSPQDPAREDKMAQLGPMHPMGRVGRPEEIAASALFLLSDQTAWVTGSLFYVDGGISLV